MQQLFIESLILLLAIFGILITVFQMFCYRTEKKLYYRTIKLKNNKGKNVEIIISADDYDDKMEDAIEKAISTYYINETDNSC